MLKPETIYDKRLVQRMIKKGTISQAAYDEYLKNLPDATGKSEPLVPEDEPQEPASKD